MGAARRAFRQKYTAKRQPSHAGLTFGRSGAGWISLTPPVGPLRWRIGPQQQLRAQREVDTLSLRRLPPRKPNGRRFSPACLSKSRTLLPPRQAGLPQPSIRPPTSDILRDTAQLTDARGRHSSAERKAGRRVFRRDVEDPSSSQGRKTFSGLACRGRAPGARTKERQAEGSSHPRFVAGARSAGALPGGDRLFGVARRPADPKGRPRRLKHVSRSGNRFRDKDMRRINNQERMERI